MKAMIFAAGLGTRLRPLTNDKPKALVQLNGKTFLQRAIEHVASFGFNEIIVNVHHFADLIIEHLKEKPFQKYNIEISDEREMLLDTGGGLKKAAHFLKDSEAFLIYNMDVYSDLNLKELYDYHLANQALATLVVRDRTSSRYLLFDKNNRLCGWQNTKTKMVKFCSRKHYVESQGFAFSGVHIIDPKIFTLMDEQQKFSIIDLYLKLASNLKIMGFRDNNSRWMDLGTHEKLDLAKSLLEKGEIS